MFLRQKIRKKDGKRHRYFSVVENKRGAGGRVVQKHVLHLGEINDSQEVAWRRSIEVLDEEADRPKKAGGFKIGAPQRGGVVAYASVRGLAAQKSGQGSR